MNIFRTMRRAASERLTTTPSDQLTASYLRLALWASIVLLWMPVVAIAAPAASFDLETQIQESPWLFAGALGFISTLTGVTALFIRIDRELSAAPDKPLPRPWIFCGAHMFGSWVAGIFAFATAQQAANPNPWTIIVMVIAGSFAGAKILEFGAEKIFGAKLPSMPTEDAP